ncbi:MAG: hypothetical protein D8B60_11760 [Moraxella sp.]|nr:MAG: hypothetical protein D8B60_11760 [Moraxella sp.]
MNIHWLLLHKNALSLHEIFWLDKISSDLRIFRLTSPWIFGISKRILFYSNNKMKNQRTLAVTITTIITMTMLNGAG